MLKRIAVGVEKIAGIDYEESVDEVSHDEVAKDNSGDEVVEVSRGTNNLLGLQPSKQQQNQNNIVEKIYLSEIANKSNQVINDSINSGTDEHNYDNNGRSIVGMSEPGTSSVRTDETYEYFDPVDGSENSDSEMSDYLESQDSYLRFDNSKFQKILGKYNYS